MPNWCSNRICVRSSKKDKNEILKFYMEIAKATGSFGGLPESVRSYKSKNPDGKERMETTDDNWYGNILLSIGITMEEIDAGVCPCRGWVSSVEMETIGDEEVAMIDVETAWNPMPEVIERAMTKYDGLYMVYVAEESGFKIYINTDATGEIFPDRFMVDYCFTDEGLEEESDRAYFTDEDELYDFIKGLLSSKYTLPAELESETTSTKIKWFCDMVQKDSEKKDDSSYLYVNEFTGE